MRRAADRLLLHAVLGDDVGQAEGLVRARQVEQRGSRPVVDGQPPRGPAAIVRRRVRTHEGRPGEDGMALPQVLAPGDAHALREQRGVDGARVGPHPARPLLLEPGDVLGQRGPVEPPGPRRPAVLVEQRDVHGVRAVTGVREGHVHPATVVRHPAPAALRRVGPCRARRPSSSSTARTAWARVSPSSGCSRAERGRGRAGDRGPAPEQVRRRGGRARSEACGRRRLLTPSPARTGHRRSRATRSTTRTRR